MDNDYALNVDEIIKTVETADVLTIRFLLLDKRLLIDNRYNEVDGPMIKLVPRVSSYEERFRSLRRLRPRFKLPEKITAIWWPKYVRTLETTGVWPALTRRMAESGFPSAVRETQEIFEELRSMERQEIRNAISGEGFQTLWPEPATSE